LQPLLVELIILHGALDQVAQLQTGIQTFIVLIKYLVECTELLNENNSVLGFVESRIEISFEQIVQEVNQFHAHQFGGDFLEHFFIQGDFDGFTVTRKEFGLLLQTIFD